MEDKNTDQRNNHKMTVQSQFSLRLFLLVLILFASSTCASPKIVIPQVNRQESIPDDLQKMTPEQDIWSPVAAPGWSQPVPVEGAINTAGGEDSPFISAQGDTLYFFFTPNVHIPAEAQVGDGVTGIWQATRSAGQWGEPQRILLADPDEAHLDGCPFVIEDWMAFCSVRAGNQREIDIYTAERQNGQWGNVQNWGEPINQVYQVGELHIAGDGNLYFGSDRPGGLGGIDLWVSPWNGQNWDAPINLGEDINTPNDENRPFVSADGQELWFDGPGQLGYPGPAVFRAQRQADGSWGSPEEIISSLAGEPTLTGDGKTLYFVHHYFSADLSRMIEADIYVSTRLAP
jgi:hypothetical protein